jgi:hypothetical protein
MALAAMTTDHWLFEIYSTTIGTLQSIVWVLLGLFFAALIGYALVQAMELKARTSHVLAFKENGFGVRKNYPFRARQFGNCGRLPSVPATGERHMVKDSLSVRDDYL